MLAICYLRRDTVFIPTTAKVDVGHYLDVEPVAVVPVADADGLRRNLLEVVAYGNPLVPPPTRADRPPPVVLKYAGVKTWSAFARGTRSWQIKEMDGRYQIVGLKESGRGGWVPDAAQTFSFPPGTPLETVVDRLVAILQEAARGT